MKIHRGIGKTIYLPLASGEISVWASFRGSSVERRST